ncbi:MAG: hypothetical protein NVV74_05900 [Magnetospirillum sp.]|nr:hypothetical protein [Magnetospirillum sp.]
MTDSKRLEFQNGHCLTAPLPERQCEYTFVRHDAALRASFVELTANESYGYLWVRDQDGEIVVLEDKPHFSPDGRHFAVVVSCEALGTSFCGIQIWSAEGPSVIWEHKVETYAEYAFIRWHGNHWISLSVLTNKDNSLVNSPAAVIETAPKTWSLRSHGEK